MSLHCCRLIDSLATSLGLRKSSRDEHHFQASLEPMDCETSSAKTPNILVTGGDSDPNLTSVLACLEKRSVDHEALLVGRQSHPRVTWDLENDILYLNGEERYPSALFIRYDVFTSLATGRPEPAQRASSWFTTLSGWAYAHPEVRLLNRASARNITNKLQVLHLAKRLGFEIPSTSISNDRTLLGQEMEKRQLIVKPVNGGAYTQELGSVLKTAPVVNDCLASPAIVQERLVPPEIRVYGIDGHFFAYQLVADALDYRSTADCRVVPLQLSDLPEGLTDRLATLMAELQLNFGAADFKACPETGQLRFLEINNSPMFVAFDAVSEGCLTSAMADFLCG